MPGECGTGGRLRVSSPLQAPTLTAHREVCQQAGVTGTVVLHVLCWSVGQPRKVSQVCSFLPSF